MFRKLLQNCAAPGVNSFGALMLWLMNRGHKGVHLWLQSFIEIPPGEACVLDVGCGGGGNIARLMKLAPTAVFHGVDPSELCVRKSNEYNREAVAAGRAHFRLGSADALPYGNDKFDLATASETIYFWRDLATDFREVLRVLKPGGTFAICNEVATRRQALPWLKRIEGMRVYSRDELCRYLAEAGFDRITFNLHENRHWVCLTARRPC